jgi:hypothetical protein
MWMEMWVGKMHEIIFLLDRSPSKKPVAVDKIGCEQFAEDMRCFAEFMIPLL